MNNRAADIAFLKALLVTAINPKYDPQSKYIQLLAIVDNHLGDKKYTRPKAAEIAAMVNTKLVLSVAEGLIDLRHQYSFEQSLRLFSDRCKSVVMDATGQTEEELNKELNIVCAACDLVTYGIYIEEE